MNWDAKLKEITQGKKLRELDKAEAKKLTTPSIKDAANFQIPVGSKLTLILPAFESAYYDTVILILVGDTDSGPYGSGTVVNGQETQVVIQENDFKAGDRVRVLSYLHIENGDVFVKGLESGYYTFT
ncbi:hypothetical protein [Pseudomonas petrae]|uniref:Uncharacterized protein n=1 Tax=Pseudomonas petrae TaxID=2912190 RepID=A0ABS9I2J2_9PSED|nr:hypothetical protein [Pseudomonas petrae]MCF7533291.1 hypothetical protein [Pseudomonas petrae]MCF7538463.1 hypothetical protein [Pseudomonas petrae]MCF7541399.1 hypothetical protein [Pseudomonas petrae]MCF7556182.1 hypothetical protein [Pseudomonas petrae]